MVFPVKMFSLGRLITPRCSICACLLVGLFMVFYFGGFFRLFQSGLASCRTDEELQRNLLRLASLTHNILITQNITHFLCYGTLWGALRQENLLPWKRDFDFCVKNEDLLWQTEEGYLRRLFRLRGADTEYSNTAAVYSIWDSKMGKEKGTVKLYVFEQGPGQQMRRIGLNRLVPMAAEMAFPSRLLALPLNSVRLRGQTFPVPREGVEIQKYHYKENWWMETKPQGC